MAFNWKGFFTGMLTKKEFSLIYIPTCLILIVFWAIARAFYPLNGGYFIDVNRISRQGNIVLNPIGCWFFIISTALTGYVLIFYYLFAYRRITLGYRFLPKLFFFFGIIGSIGFMLVGLCPEGSSEQIELIHDIGNAMAFGGLGISAFISFLIMFRKIYRKDLWPNPSQVGIFFLLILQFGLIMVFIQSGSMMQWTGFFIMLIWNFGFYIILPESVPPK